MNQLLKSADQISRKNFRYVAETKDEWRSHAADVAAGRSWEGDCDDLASTACHIAINNGFKKENLWFAMVSSTRSKKVDHLIAIAEDRGAYYVIGDTFDPIYNAKNMPHRLLFVHRLDWPTWQWKRASSVSDLATSSR